VYIRKAISERCLRNTHWQNCSEVSDYMPIPKDDSAYKILQAPNYSRIGDISWTSNEFWGTLLSGAVVGVMAVTLFNRYYK